jgi:peptidase M23-like protein
MRRRLLLLAGTAPAFGAGRPLDAQSQFPPFLELRVPKAPTVAQGERGPFLTYELHVTSFAAQPMTLKRVEVATGNGAARRVLFSAADSTLPRMLTRPGTQIPLAERATIAPGTHAVVFLWVPVDRASLPANITNRVVVVEGSDSARTQDVDGPSIAVARPGPTIGPPLRGGPWLAGNGPSAQSGHRRALVPVGGVSSIAQRFAIDWVRVGDDNRRFRGDSLANSSYFAWGQDAIAVADGIVVAVKDSIPENVPGANSRAVLITLETIGGNHVIVDIGNGRYAFYAHLQPGSPRVKVGDRVKRGQVLGLVGNSGNSTEPHLHFHLSDGNSPLGSEGIPYDLDSFEIVGHCEGFTQSCTRGAAVVRRGEVPLADALVRFP